jgi:3-hydroxyacyl-[acyl-carrier protein] dehydratase/trans-2-decenoyl-[acyl-carrier protein] isomerase
VVGSASVKVDGEEIYRIEKARVGTFSGIAYSDYPLSSENAHGGRIER